MRNLKKAISRLVGNDDQGLEKTKERNNYFGLARSWADDFYVSVVSSRNRWRALSLWILIPLSFLLLICVTFLIPEQHLVPLMINHYENGETIVTPLKQRYAPINQAQVESDIAKYVRFRESYSPETYDYSYRLMHLMSSDSVDAKYNALQSISNKSSPINLLGDKGYEKVKIESIVFLDNENKNTSTKNASSNKKDDSFSRFHKNLAQINFAVITNDGKTGQKTTVPLTALVSWEYRGTPDDPSDRWMDWNGFMVTHYEINQRNV